MLNGATTVVRTIVADGPQSPIRVESGLSAHGTPSRVHEDNYGDDGTWMRNLKEKMP